MINIADLRRSSLRWSLLIVVPLAWLLATSTVWEGLSILDNGAQAVVASVTVSGPLLGAVAAWDASRIKRCRLNVPWTTSAIGAWRGSTSILLASLSWSGISYLVVAAAVLTPMYAAGTIGGGQWLWLICGVFGQFVQVTAGHLAGTIFPHKLTAALTGPALYALVLVFLILNAQVHERFLFLSPTVQQSAEPYFAINNTLLSWQWLWYLGLLAAIWGSLVLFLKARRITAFALIGAGFVAAGFGAAGVFSTQPGFLKVTSYSVASGCEQDGNLTLCLHPAYESARGLITQQLLPMQEKLEGTPLAFHKVEVRNRGAFGLPEDPKAAVMHIDDLAPGWEDRDRSELALSQAIAPSGPCVVYGMDGAARSFAVGFGRAVLAWSLGKSGPVKELQSGQNAALEAFEQLPEAEKPKWITSNMKDICLDSVTTEDFE